MSDVINAAKWCQQRKSCVKMQGECKLGAGASENHFGTPKFGTTSVVLKISGFCSLCQILMYICGIQNLEIYGSSRILAY